jgi:deazaflavin-dependent oxidoreductase (nitroreductase family)
MTFLQAFRDRVRVVNKKFTNKLTMPIAGKGFGHFAVLTHKGRRTGTLYRIPLIAEPAPDGFVIALTYGRKVDWAANVLAAGGCSLRWKNSDYALGRPEFIDRETGLKAFPLIFRIGLRAMGISDFLRLSKGKSLEK